MSIAQAILEYIHDHIGAKTMFSTHYHELTSLEASLKHLKNVHVSAVLENDKLTFLHKVKQGSIDKSYGIHVASLASLPKELIKRSKEILEVYEDTSPKRETFTQTSLFQLDEDEVEKVIEENEIESEIKAINPLEMSPMEALNFLFELRNKIK